MIFTHKANLNSTQIEERIEEDAKKIGLMMKKHFGKISMEEKVVKEEYSSLKDLLSRIIIRFEIT